MALGFNWGSTGVGMTGPSAYDSLSGWGMGNTTDYSLAGLAGNGNGGLGLQFGGMGNGITGDLSGAGGAGGFLSGIGGLDGLKTGLGAIGGLAQAYMGMQQYGLAKKTLAENQRQFDLNYAAQRDTTNTAMRDRQAARVASNPGAYQSVDDYMAANQVR